ncbi:MAG TPA: hypothetical protein VF185_00580 [Patescibacteria group bacterium]
MRSKEHYTNAKRQERCYSCSGIYDCPLYLIKNDGSYLSSAIKVTQRQCESYNAVPGKGELEYIIKGALKYPNIQ